MIALPAVKKAWCSRYLPTGQMVIVVGSDEAARKHCVDTLLSLVRGDLSVGVMIDPINMRTELTQYTDDELSGLSEFVQYANK